MGTLFQQKVRDGFNVDLNDIESYALRLKRMAERLEDESGPEITIDHLIRIKEVLEIERATNAYIYNGDVYDEQMMGFGELFDRFIKQRGE